jgi:hypothetical protein
VPDRIRAWASLWCLALLVACSSDHHATSDESILAGNEVALGRFVCEGSHCIERQPRLPDDGEWSCNDVGGIAVCVGGDPPAGIPKNIRDPAFICGPRRARNAAPSGERVCVDLAPSFPSARAFSGGDGSARGWSCRYTSGHGVTRVCDRDSSAHQIGDRCDNGHPCLDGLSCRASRCTLARSTPSCAFDRDCSSGACRFGTCIEDGSQLGRNEAP